MIGSVRDTTDPSVQELKDIPVATGSRLLLVAFESTSATEVAKAIREIEAAGITHLDLVIANAGICPTPTPISTVDIKDVTAAFNVNTGGPLILFQAVRHLLEKSTSSPKWVSISTAVASLSRLEEYQVSGVAAYGISKAGMNWVTL